MNQREMLLSAATLALGSASLVTSSATAAPKPAGETIECFGINSCKGTNGCAVGKAQMKAANEAFAHKFEKSGVADCSGTTECSAKTGHLAWIAKDSEDACFKAGGFVFTKDKKGDFVVRAKAEGKSQKT